MKKLLLLLLAPLLLVSCSSDDDDVDNPDGFLAKNADVAFLENYEAGDYIQQFLIFNTKGHTWGEVDIEDPTYFCDSDFYPWNVTVTDDGETEKYEVTENTENTLKIKYTYSYEDPDYPEDNESGEATFTVTLDGNVLTIKGTDSDGESFTETYYKGDAPC